MSDHIQVMSKAQLLQMVIVSSYFRKYSLEFSSTGVESAVDQGTQCFGEFISNDRDQILILATQVTASLDRQLLTIPQTLDPQGQSTTTQHVCS